MMALHHSLACGLLNDDPRGCTCQPDAPAVLAAERAERETRQSLSTLPSATADVNWPSSRPSRSLPSDERAFTAIGERVEIGIESAFTSAQENAARRVSDGRREESPMLELSPRPIVPRPKAQGIRYEIQCRFCARHIGGDNAAEAMWAIGEHDETHRVCTFCHVTRVTSEGASVCDDCWPQDTERTRLGLAEFLDLYPEGGRGR